MWDNVLTCLSCKTTSFLVHFLLPAGQALSLKVEPDTTVSGVKEKLCLTAQTQKNLILLNYTLYELYTYGKSLLLSENEILGGIRYITKCRRKSTIPKLELVQKKFAPFTRQVGNHMMNPSKLMQTRLTAT